MLRERCLRLAETLRPDQAATGIGIILRIRTRLYAAAAKVNIHPTLEKSTMFELAQQCDIFHPAEALFNPLALLLADVVAGMARGARIDRPAAPPRRLLRHVRSHMHQRHSATNYAVSKPLSPPTVMRPAIARNLLQHYQRRSRSGRPLASRTSAFTRQPAAILNLQIAAVTQLKAFSQ